MSSYLVKYERFVIVGSEVLDNVVDSMGLQHIHNFNSALKHHRVLVICVIFVLCNTFTNIYIRKSTEVTFHVTKEVKKSLVFQYALFGTGAEIIVMLRNTGS